MDDRIAAARAKLGSHVLLLGHHYQRDEVIRFADVTGDSYKLSKIAHRPKPSTSSSAACISWPRAPICSAARTRRQHHPAGHPARSERRLLHGRYGGDLAGRSRWEALEKMGLTDGLIPLTYMNSTAAIKAFCGERGGLVCTSSNARAAFEWAFERGKRIFFLPDQHLGRNTGHAMGIPLKRCRSGTRGRCKAARRRRARSQPHHPLERPLLRPSALPAQPRRSGARQVSRHPGHRASRVPLGGLPESRRLGSTERLIQLVEDAPAGSIFAIGTEIHLVNRLAKRFAPQGKKIITLDDSGCLCTTMYRISPQHLAWALENLVEGRVVNQIQVGAA
jgi:quinolinate synthase